METKVQNQELKREDKTPASLVKVVFSDNRSFMYFCDYNVEVGDLVTVEGKREYMVGRVVEVAKQFKHPQFDMKWITSILDADLSGKYMHLDDGYWFSCNSKLTACNLVALFYGLRLHDGQAYGEQCDGEELLVGEIPQHFDRELAIDFFAVNNGVGKAVVESEKKLVTVDFILKESKLTYIACDCGKLHCDDVKRVTDAIKFVLNKCGNVESLVVVCKGVMESILRHGKGNISFLLAKDGCSL